MAPTGRIGGDYEAAVIRSLGERLDAEIDRRIDERVGPPPAGGGLDLLGLGLALASIGIALGVPSAMSGHFGGGLTFVLTLVAWAMIAAINIAYALGAAQGSDPL